MKKSSYVKRRQQFLDQAYAGSREVTLRQWTDELYANSSVPELGLENISLDAAQLADNVYAQISLAYTSGEAIEKIREELAQVVVAYERHQKALAEFEQAPLMSPLGLDQLGDYERAMQIMGLCILLHRPDLLNRMAALIDPGYKGEDTLYEDLLAFYQSGRVELDEWYHDEPYTPLIRAIYEDGKDQAAALLNEYVESWYPAFKYVPWHDGHLRINGTDGDYFGYWAFEAGAVAYLCNIDDSAVTHMVYPKDLVDWARSHAHLSGATVQERQLNRLRCEAGQPCLKDGECEVAPEKWSS